MIPSLHQIKLLHCLEIIEELSGEFDFYNYSEVDEEASKELDDYCTEAEELLDSLRNSISQIWKEQLLYRVITITDESSQEESEVLRLDFVLERYPFLAEAILLANIQEISFKNGSTKVTIQKIN